MTGGRRLRAPRADGATLAEPPLADAGRLLAANGRLLATADLRILGRPLADLRRSARQAALAAARDYLRRAGEPIPELADGPLLLAGHQPELFHPGVWAKNFALCGLARAHGATSLNLIVDNDIVKATALRVPAKAAPDGRLEPLVADSDVPAADDLGAWPHPATVPFDRWTAEAPYEERKVLDEALFATLPQRIEPLAAAWGFRPLLPAFWVEAVRQRQRTAILGERLVAARRAAERAWGCHNLELSFSLLCRTEPFAWFASHLLAELPRFHAAYNECLHEYRRRNGIRSRAHPVPDLAAEGGWLEVPLWAWRADRPRRSRLLARVGGQTAALRMDAEPGPTLPLALGDHVGAAVAAWQALESQGLKVRSRALTNTLFARWFLGDLFIHGIGGAKYDELTDAIARRFYGIEPPGYLALSGTLLLPVPTLPASADECRRLGRQVRDLRWNPQRYLADGQAPTPEAAALAAEKQRWAAREPAEPSGRRARFQVLQNLTRRLQPFVAEREARARHRLDECTYQQRVNEVLQRRDYAFCLFPEAKLRPFCTQFLSPTPSLSGGR